MQTSESVATSIEPETLRRDPSTDQDRNPFLQIVGGGQKEQPKEQEIEGSLGETEINKQGIIGLNHNKSRMYIQYTNMLRSLNNIDWTFTCQQKSSPINQMTPVAYWFMICAQYFQKDQESLVFQQIKKLNIHREGEVESVKRNYDFESDLNILEYRKVLKVPKDPENMQLDDMIDTYEKELFNIKLQHDTQIKTLETSILCHSQLLQFKDIPNSDGLLRDICGLTSDELEYIDRRETYIQMQASQNEEFNLKLNSNKIIRKANQRMSLDDYDGALCQVCNDGDYQDDNLIVFCQKCNMAVHQKCYLVNEIPSGDWVCDVCFTFGINGQYLRCALCPKLGGAMKQTQISVDVGLFQINNPSYHISSFFRTRKQEVIDTDFQYNNAETMHRDIQFFQDELNTLLEPKPSKVWVHQSCLFWTPECYVEEKFDILRGLENIDKKRFLLGCSICGQKKMGASIQCSRGSCQIAYHPECARRANKLMSITTTSANRIEYQMFCDKHTPFKLKRILETKHRFYEKEIIEFFKTYEKHRTQHNKQLKKKIEQKIIQKKLNKTKSKQKTSNLNGNINKYLTHKYQFSDEEVLNFARYFKEYIELPNSLKIVINLEKTNNDDYKIVDINLPKTPYKPEYQLRLVPDFLKIKPTSLQNELLPFYRGYIQSDDPLWSQLNYKDYNQEKIYSLYSLCTRRASRYMQELNQGKVKRQAKLIELLTRKQYQRTTVEQKKEIVSKIINNEYITQDDNQYCVCRGKFVHSFPMICIRKIFILNLECEMCDEWYHFECLAVTSGDKVDKIQFYCFLCEVELEPKLKKKVKDVYKKHFEDPSFYLQKQLAKQTNLGQYRLENMKQRLLQASQLEQSNVILGSALNVDEQIQLTGAQNKEQLDQKQLQSTIELEQEQIQAIQQQEIQSSYDFEVQINTPIKCIDQELHKSSSKPKSLQKQSNLLDFYKKRP